MKTPRDGWTETRLGDHLRIKHGYAFKGAYFADAGPFIVLTPGNFYDAGGFKRKDKEKFYSGEVPEGFVLKRGDLIVAMTEQAYGLLGSSAIVPEDNLYLHNQRLGLVVDLDQAVLNRGFLYYLMNTKEVRDQLQATATGIKVRHTSPSRIADVTVKIPATGTQRRIASALSAYDDLIGNNLRRIQILGKMAQALYREWFVKFRYPGRSGGDLADGATGREPPDEWEAMPLGDVCEVLRGRSYRSQNLVQEGGLPFVNLKCVDRDGGFRVSGLKRYDGPLKDSQLVRPGDIVMAVTDMTQERRIVARAARVPDFGEAPAAFSMDLVRIAPAEHVAPLYLYAALRWSSFPDEVKQHASGVNVLHLSPDLIRDYKILVPPLGLRNEYDRLVTPMFRLQDGLAKANAALRRARDLLLPRLISGELDVSELDIDVGEAA